MEKQQQQLADFGLAFQPVPGMNLSNYQLHRPIDPSQPKDKTSAVDISTAEQQR